MIGNKGSCHSLFHCNRLGGDEIELLGWRLNDVGGMEIEGVVSLSDTGQVNRIL